MKSVRYKKDCDNECETCVPVDTKTYKGYTDEQKDNEAKKSGCRSRQSVDRVLGNIPEGHSTVIAEWHHGNQ